MSQHVSLAAQMKHRDREMVPLVLVRAMFGLMLAALALVTYATVTDRPLTGVLAASPIAQQRIISLQGTRADGVAVLDANGTQIAHSTDEKSGFIDVIWNSVTRERTVQNVALGGPLTLVRRENGQTAILDPSTGWSITLIGYGQDNVASFASLLD